MNHLFSQNSRAGWARFQHLLLKITFPILSCLVLSQPLHGQKKDDDPIAMYRKAVKEAENNDYKAAAAIYEDIIKIKKLSDLIVFQCKYNLAFCYYLLGENEKAIKRFDEVIKSKTTDKSPKEILALQERSALLICAAQSNLANAAKSASDRQSGQEETIRLYNSFLRKYPKSEFRGDAFYGKALATLQSGRPDDAESSLQEFMKNAKETLLDEAKYLMARIYSTQGKALAADGKKAEADKKFAAARKIYDEFASSAKDLVLAYESLLSAGEMLVKNGSYSEAIPVLRRVKPKDTIVQAQEGLISQIRRSIAQAIAAGNKLREEDLKQQMERIKQRLASIQNSERLYSKAQQLISQAYYEQKKYNEVLILNRHMIPSFEGEDKKLARYLIVKSLLGVGKDELAAQENLTFRETYPDDKLTDDLDSSFARWYSAAKRYDDCIKWALYYKKHYPSGSYREEILYMLSDAYTRSGKAQEAEKAAVDFQKEFPKSDLFREALFLSAYSKLNTKDYEGAIKGFREYLEKSPGSQNAPYALLNIADCYKSLGQLDSSIQALKEFGSKFPDNKELLPKALFIESKIHEMKKDYNAANAIHARIVKEFPKHEYAPFSQYQIGINDLSQGNAKLKEAMEAFDKYIELYPNHEAVPNAYYYKAEINKSLGAKEGKPVDEIVKGYQEVLNRFPDHAVAGEALVAMAGLYSSFAMHLAGRPDKLPEEKKKQWQESVQKAQDTYLSIIVKFPDQPSVDKALSELSRIWEMRIKAKFVTKDDAIDWFRHSIPDTNPGVQIKSLFTLGGLLGSIGEREDALEHLLKGYDKAGAISLPNEGYQQLREFLFEDKKYDKAIEVSERQLKEKQTAGDQNGIVEATLGLGEAYYLKDDITEATKRFQDISDNAKWNPTCNITAEYYLGMIDIKNKSFEEAIKRFGVILKQARETRLKVRIWMGLGYAWMGKSEKVPSARNTSMKEALGYFIRVGTGFGAFPEYASESLYMTGQIYEKYAASATDPKAKSDAIANARKFYNLIDKNYPKTDWAAKATDRLKAIGQ